MKGWEWGLGLGLATGLGAAAGMMLVKRRRAEDIPGEEDARWVEAGRLSQLTIHPVKSGHYVSLTEADCTPLGLAVTPTPGLLTLRDRFLVVYRGDDGAMVTARTYPTMLQVRAEPQGEHQVLLSHPSHGTFTLTIPSHNNTSHVRMWNAEEVETADCGEGAAHWITKVILGMAQVKPNYRLGCWLVDKLSRRNLVHHKQYSPEYCNVSNNDGGSYCDLTSYMLMTKSSVDDLSAKLNGKSITVKQFRPNLFIDNQGKPFEEDGWKWVKIGKDAIFKNIKPCTRCILTTIDPETSKRDAAGEPLKTLKKYRLVENSHSPVMGINLGLYSAGSVRLGDAVLIIPK